MTAVAAKLAPPQECAPASERVAAPQRLTDLLVEWYRTHPHIRPASADDAPAAEGAQQ